ncbi:hypothetical protein D3C72_2439680 [compost metagenome]
MLPLSISLFAEQTLLLNKKCIAFSTLILETVERLVHHLYEKDIDDDDAGIKCKCDQDGRIQLEVS